MVGTGIAEWGVPVIATTESGKLLCFPANARMIRSRKLPWRIEVMNIQALPKYLLDLVTHEVRCMWTEAAKGERRQIIK